MKKLILMLLLLVSIFLQACDNNYDIGEDFDVSYVDVRSARNVYYRNQGIFEDLSITFVIYDKDFILVRGDVYKNGSPIDTSTHYYYIIDKKAYINNPSQMKSKGLIGPISLSNFQAKRKELSNAKTLPL